MKILIVRLTALGDIIHSATVLEFIKREKPDIQIDWLIEESFKAILEDNIYLDNIYSVNLKSLKRDRSFQNIRNIYSKLKDISKNRYDLVIDMQGLIKSSIVSTIISNKIHGYSYRSGKEGVSSFLYKTKTFSNYSENKILRNIKLVNDALDLKISKQDILNKKPHLFYSDTNFSANQKTIFVVGSTMFQKNYPKEKFLQLAEKLKRDITIIWGDLKERNIATSLSEQSKYISLAPKMNLNQLKYYISTAKLVIGNDTGPTHLAWAMNIPSITLFGLTPVEQAFETDINLILKSETKVNHHKIDKNDLSIRDIKVEDIIKKIDLYHL